MHLCSNFYDFFFTSFVTIRQIVCHIKLLGLEEAGAETEDKRKLEKSRTGFVSAINKV